MMAEAALPLHHPVFSKFEPWQGFAEPGFEMNFLGVRTRQVFFSSTPSTGRTFVAPPLPGFDEEYPEWVDVLESVLGATELFTMVELGAGWGRWLVNAAASLRKAQRGTPFVLVGVEAEPTHFEWMKLHLLDNGIDLNSCILINAVVAERDGGVWFQTGRPSDWYGQGVVRWPFTVQTEIPDAQVRRVWAKSLDHILAPLPLVDLMDIDIQGMELAVLRAAAERVDSKVKRLHIGTHDQEIETGLRALFSKLGWEKIQDFPGNSDQETPWGTIRFQDGVQSWVNPKLRAR